MKPTINLHGVVSVRLERVNTFRHFSTRRLVLTDKDGDTFCIGLFADDAANLVPEVDAAAPLIQSYDEPVPEDTTP